MNTKARKIRLGQGFKLLQKGYLSLMMMIEDPIRDFGLGEENYKLYYLQEKE
jgi:hypothetical protein